MSKHVLDHHNRVVDDQSEAHRQRHGVRQLVAQSQRWQLCVRLCKRASLGYPIPDTPAHRFDLRIAIPFTQQGRLHFRLWEQLPLPHCVRFDFALHDALGVIHGLSERFAAPFALARGFLLRLRLPIDKRPPFILWERQPVALAQWLRNRVALLFTLWGRHTYLKHFAVAHPLADGLPLRLRFFFNNCLSLVLWEWQLVALAQRLRISVSFSHALRRRYAYL